jgi:SAM-dependent methyltransferase
MDDHQKELFVRLRERYSSGEVPWDDPSPPPEVIDFVPSLNPGRALDLGCGYGRATIYLASLGWEVDGIDFIPEAVSVAANRAMAQKVAARFHIASITDLDFLSGPYDFALDVGCSHNLDENSLRIYRSHLARLIKPGGFFLLFARLRQENSVKDEQDFRGLDLDQITGLYSSSFELDWHRLGETVIDLDTSWPSGWFRFKAIPEE